MANFSIPLGYKYRFQPEDHELITYLSCKANGEPLPSEGVIKEIDLYGMNDPGKLFQRTQEKAVYVFTKVKKVGENGKRVDRKVSGNRTWKGVDKGHPIYDEEGCLVGEKKNFNFMNKMKMKLGYNMTEFVLDEKTLSRAKFKNYVLCQIKKKEKKERSAEERCLKPAIEEELNSIAAMEEESNTSSTVSAVNVMAENSVVTTAFPLPESAEPYCHFSGLLEGSCSDQIAFAPVVAFDNEMTDLGFSEASTYGCQNQEYWMNNTFPEYAQNQEEEAEASDDLSIWNLIQELASPSPPVSLYDRRIFCSTSALALPTEMSGFGTGTMGAR